MYFCVRDIEFFSKSYQILPKKRLLFTVSNDLSHDQRMIRICSTLADAGYSVQLIGRNKSNSTPLVAQNFEQKRLPIWAQKGKLFYLELNIRLFFYLLFQRFDAVCAVDLDTILPVFYVSRLRRRPCVYDAHEYFTQTPEVVRRPAIQRIWTWVARHTIPNIPYCYTVGEELAKVLSEEYSVHFEVIRNVPFRQVTTEKTIPRNHKIILYQGALNEGRGLEQVLNRMPQLPSDTQLWLCGEGELSEILRQQVRDLDIAERVYFYGWVAPDALKILTQQAYIGLNVLENKGLSYYYSLANKFFDYVQAHKPQLTMDFPAYKHLNVEYEVAMLLSDVNDLEALQQALEKLLTDTDYYAHLQANAQIAADIWIWENEAARLLRLYERVLKAAKIE
jgi:glycosyltransferase involved in cell wall biosynthesis